MTNPKKTEPCDRRAPLWSSVFSLHQPFFLTSMSMVTDVDLPDSVGFDEADWINVSNRISRNISAWWRRRCRAG